VQDKCRKTQCCGNDDRGIDAEGFERQVPG
jgi:hypothetical protein